LAANANDSFFSPTYNPALLARTSALSSDISFLLGVSYDDGSWKTHPIHQSLISSPPPAFGAYISRLTHLIEVEPRRLLAHSYIRYMGDLSGGQIMKRNIRNAYGLAGEHGATFFEFRVMGSEGKSNPPMADTDEVKRIKEWFKSGIDAGVGSDLKMKGRSICNRCLGHERLIGCAQTGALLDETTRAFVLHQDIFNELAAPSPKVHKPVAWTPNSTLADLEPEGSKVFSVTSVLTFMVAVGMAHFIIVVGGLSGSRGYAKLEALHAWVTSTISSN